MQREAPAHVMLRILWLNPRDFCCFEYYFERWTLWMAKRICSGENYSNCDFLRILFKKHFLKLNDCEDCITCSCGEESPVSCQPEDKDYCSETKIVDNINKLFCWSAKDDFDFTNCESCGETPVAVADKKKIKGPVIAESIKLLQPEVNEMQVEENETIEATATDATLQQDDSEETDIFRVRNKRYNEKIHKVLSRNEDNVIANKVEVFFKKTPLPQNFSNLINEILNDKTNKAKNIRGFSAADKKVLIQNITWKYLDLVCSDNAEDLEKITTLKPTFKIIKNGGLDISSLYKDWNSKEFSQFTPAINFNKIKNSLKGS